MNPQTPTPAATDTAPEDFTIGFGETETLLPAHITIEYFTISP